MKIRIKLGLGLMAGGTAARYVIDTLLWRKKMGMNSGFTRTIGSYVISITIGAMTFAYSYRVLDAIDEVIMKEMAGLKKGEEENGGC